MKNFPESLAKKLQQRKEANALRILPAGNNLVDFASNDYLGFSANETIFKEAYMRLKNKETIQNGATGSRLLSGNHDFYSEAEDYIALFHEAESALLFNSGYDANIGLFSAILQKGDLILYDEYVHASIRDGIRLSTATAYKFAHNDIEGLEKLINRYYNAIGTSGNEIYIVTESVFSMDGDSPDIAAIVSMCQKYDCRLIIDEAHAIGVFGTKGQGLVQDSNLHSNVFARVVTFGKGLGCHGAAVLGAVLLKQYLVNFARSFIYTTGLPPHSVATLLAAYKCLNDDVQVRQELLYNISFFRSEVTRLQLDNLFIYSASAIHCAVIPGNEKVKNIASVLQSNGFNVKAILSPTVPQGQERLRFCLHSYNTPQQITAVLECLRSALLL